MSPTPAEVEQTEARDVMDVTRLSLVPCCNMESDSSDVECLPDLKSLDDFLASSFDADISVDDEDEVAGWENADS